MKMIFCWRLKKSKFHINSEGGSISPSRSAIRFCFASLLALNVYLSLATKLFINNNILKLSQRNKFILNLKNICVITRRNKISTFRAILINKLKQCAALCMCHSKTNEHAPDKIVRSNNQQKACVRFIIYQ